MFTYDCADINYCVTWGKGDSSSDIDYSVDLTKKEAKRYTEARMLGENLDLMMDTYRMKREIIRFEKDEYGTDIGYARISISFCDNQEQPPYEDVEAYLTGLLKAHKYELAHDVVEAQINVYDDTDSDWRQVALDLAKELHCPGYIKRYGEEATAEEE